MKIIVSAFFILLILSSCSDDVMEPITYDNPEIELSIPNDFPALNPYFSDNKPTKYGVELGKSFLMTNASVQITLFPVPVAIFHLTLLQTIMLKV